MPLVDHKRKGGNEHSWYCTVLLALVWCYSHWLVLSTTWLGTRLHAASQVRVHEEGASPMPVTVL